MFSLPALPDHTPSNVRRPGSQPCDDIRIDVVTLIEREIALLVSLARLSVCSSGARLGAFSWLLSLERGFIFYFLFFWPATARLP